MDIHRVKETTKHIHVFAPHVDPIPVGHGLADILPQILVLTAAGISNGTDMYNTMISAVRNAWDERHN